MQKIYQSRVSAIILAAGRGIRMGCPKWELRMSSGEYLISHTYRQFSQFGCETVVVVNGDDVNQTFFEEVFAGIRYAINNRYDLGRLYSLQCGLKELSAVSPCFVHNIDNPFVSQELLSTLVAGLDGYDYALPQFQDRGGHPLLVGKDVVAEIEAFQGLLPELRQVLGTYNANRINVSNPNILLNINTPEDYQRFLRLRG